MKPECRPAKYFIRGATIVMAGGFILKAFNKQVVKIIVW